MVSRNWSKLLVLMFMIPTLLSGVSYQQLVKILDTDLENQPFTYNLGINVLKGRGDDEPVMVCFHGYGSSNKVIDILSTYQELSDHLVSFNFPDYNIKPNARDPRQTTFGTIDELLPAIYVLKKLIIDGGLSRVDLYGFSAGGGALVNMLAVLNSNRYPKEISALGVSQDQRKTILKAIQNGNIVLDCPLKSIDEIIAFRGETPELAVFNQTYQNNSLVPIDSIKELNNLSLNVLLHFQNNDEALSNRDDKLYINTLRHTNTEGRNCVVIGSDGGHISYHKSLWRVYPAFISGKSGSSCVLDYSK